jgi:hypothetical protein
MYVAVSLPRFAFFVKCLTIILQSRHGLSVRHRRTAAVPRIPRHFRAISGPSAVDPKFKTIDFLTLFVLERAHDRVDSQLLKLLFPPAAEMLVSRQLFFREL